MKRLEPYWKVEERSRDKGYRRSLALVDAATAALPAIEDPALADDLRTALAAFDIKVLRQNVASADKRAAEEAAEQANIDRGEQAFGDLPDAPKGVQCEVRADQTWSRMTEWGRCERVAKRIVLDENRRERCVCVQHAKFVLINGKPKWGWSDEKTHESWYRIHKQQAPK